ncbi:hypothetical protein E6P97_01190 [Patescibacteria group bacterium]|nr:MAG: hypothetical protein E6P97_01190 [Patescibacteria group bacterium]
MLKTKNFFTHFIAFVVIVLTFVLLSVAPAFSASETRNFIEIGTHPQADAQSSTIGKTIHKLQIFNGKLYSGYGDYNANTGPISINPFDLTTRTFDGEAISAPTETLGNWEVIDGKLYTTTIDQTCGATCSGGYAAGDSNHSWEVETPVTAEHIYDIATLTGTDLWLFGSSGGSTATAWRSTNGGSTWNVIQTYENVSGGDNTERYYWGAALNGRMYMQSDLFGYNNPVQSFDGTSWSTGTTEKICGTGDAGKGPNPVVFNGRIVCEADSGYELSAFDGTNNQTISIFDDDLDCSDGCYGPELNDMAVVGNSLYVMRNVRFGSNPPQVTLYKTTDLVNWDTIEGLPSTTTSFAIDETSEGIYVGTSDSKIYYAQANQSVDEGTGSSSSVSSDGGTSQDMISTSELARTGSNNHVIIFASTACFMLAVAILRARAILG